MQVAPVLVVALRTTTRARARTAGARTGPCQTSGEPFAEHLVPNATSGTRRREASSKTDAGRASATSGPRWHSVGPPSTAAATTSIHACPLAGSHAFLSARRAAIGGEVSLDECNQVRGVGPVACSGRASEGESFATMRLKRSNTTVAAATQVISAWS